MKRRDFIRLVGGTAIACPFTARAQQPDRVRRIGVLMATADDSDGRSRIAAFQGGLQEWGWREGHNVRIDIRWAGGNIDRARAYAAELVGLLPDVIVAGSTSALRTLRNETHTIPIVFAQVSDPVGQGFVESLARPNANITGFTNFESSMTGKWLEILKEIAPRVGRVALMFNPDTAPYIGYYLRALESAGPSLTVKPIAAPVHNPTDIESTLAALGRDAEGGLIVMPDTFTTVHRKLIVSLAAQHRVPTIYTFRYFAAEGGLISYGSDTNDLFRRVASYVDRILKGVKPAELPVQAPMKFELVINLKTAEALGLTVPPTLLFQADEVIK